MDSLDRSFKASRKVAPSWSMRAKPEMISGDSVPSWVKSIPGPKYFAECDKFKPRAPAWAFRPPGPSKTTEVPESASVPLGPTMAQMAKGYSQTIPQQPKYTIALKQDLSGTHSRNFGDRIRKELQVHEYRNTSQTGWLSLDTQLMQVGAQLMQTGPAAPRRARRQDAKLATGSRCTHSQPPKIAHATAQEWHPERLPAWSLGYPGTEPLESAGARHSRSVPQIMTETRIWRLGNLLEVKGHCV